MKNLRRLSSNLTSLSWQQVTASLLVGVSAGFFVYIFFLQTAVFSRRSLLLGTGIALAAWLAAYYLLRQHPFALKNDYFLNRRSLLLAGSLYLLALPSYFFLPPYPALPFLQRQSKLAITVKTGTDPITWSQFRKIYLNSGVEKLGFKSFQVSGSWIARDDDYFLPPKSTGQITWSGQVGRRASLALPIPAQGLTLSTDWDNEIRLVTVDKSPYVRNKNFIPPLWYAALIYFVAVIPLSFVFLLMEGFPWVRRIAVPALILALALIQVDLQFQMLGSEFHKPVQEAIWDVQLSRHAAVLNGTAPNPWQYRVFSEWVLDGFLFLSARLPGLANSAFSALWSLRLLQNLVLLVLAYLYFTRLGITKAVSLYGVFLLAGGMLHVFHESDLSFNTYFDIIFYLLAALLILNEKSIWVPLVMVPAALNRETSAMIPVLLLAYGWMSGTARRTQALWCGLIGLFVWGGIFGALHLYFPHAPIFEIGQGIVPGWALFRYNLTVPQTPLLLFQTFGFLPLLAAFAYRDWHKFVRVCFLFLVPAWILVHALSSVWAETRLFLVLLAVVLIPAVLPLIDRLLQEVRQWNGQTLELSGIASSGPSIV